MTSVFTRPRKRLCRVRDYAELRGIVTRSGFHLRGYSS